MNKSDKQIKFKKLNIFFVFKLYFFLKRNKNDENNFHPHKYNIKNVIKNTLDSQDIYIIQLYNKKMVGYGMLRGWKEGYEIPTLGIIIDNKYRGLGLSKIMMNYLHEMARNKKSKEIYLKVKNDNFIAINLYKKFDYKLSNFNDEFLIGKKLL